jgi:hypothetical protein
MLCRTGYLLIGLVFTEKVFNFRLVNLGLSTAQHPN